MILIYPRDQCRIGIMSDMGDARRKYKLLKQKGGSCVIFSIETTKQIAQI